MKTQTILLSLLFLELIIALIAFIDFSNQTKLSQADGSRGAYFTEIKYPSIIHQGEKITLTLTIYNKECSIDDGNASFFLIFYVNNDLWLNEFNSTEYRTWRCEKGNAVTRHYMIAGLEDIKPVTHNLRAELFWYRGDEAVLQDVKTANVTVALIVEANNLLIHSYLTVYLIAIFLLGFYITLNGHIIISPSSQNAKLKASRQSSANKGLLSRLCNSAFSFYLFVFASWQGINIAFYAFPIPARFLCYVHLMVQICYFAILIVLIKKNGSNFAELGYIWPEASHRYIFYSLFLGVFYSFLTIFLPGAFKGYEIFPSNMNVFCMIFFSIISSFIVESIFRGYIQTKLINSIGFPHAIFVTSIMYALYMVSFAQPNQFYLAYEILSFFIVGILLGFLFHKMKTLLSPIIFHATLLIFKDLTPIKAIEPDYTILFGELVALAFTLILLHIFVTKGDASKIYLSKNVEDFFGASS
ncbi:MAG: type II CAAX endopeptidase family protein [Candidatus Bathyarchaeia archaeon]